MKSLRSSLRATLFACSLLMAGCGTATKDAQRIVEDADVASLSAELNATSGNLAAGGPARNWQAVSNRIETYIAAHPGQTPTNAALRVRQALMLLQNGQDNLAEAAFAEAARGPALAPRDQALRALRSELVWWYRVSSGSLNNAAIAKGREALTAIARECDTLNRGTPEEKAQNESIRDFLAAMRATIALKIAFDGFLGDTARPFVEDAINIYAATLPAGETTRWQAEPNWPPANVSIETAVGASSRRRFRAEFLIEKAREIVRGKNIRAASTQIADPYFKGRIFSR